MQISYKPLVERFSIPSRITSYNVCYTKLLRIQELEKAIKKGYIPEELQDQVSKVLHHAFNSFLHDATKNLKDVAEKPEADRITSYNVCYTKLLRSWRASQVRQDEGAKTKESGTAFSTFLLLTSDLFSDL